MLLSSTLRAQTMCAIDQGNTGNGQGITDYNADNSSNRYLNGGETPNKYAAFYTAEVVSGF